MSHTYHSFSAAYAIVVRGSEYDLPPDMLDDIVARSISSFGSSNDYRQQDVERHDGVELFEGTLG